MKSLNCEEFLFGLMGAGVSMPFSGDRLVLMQTWTSPSTAGEGAILQSKVRCIGPEWMFKFKTTYPPEEKDLQDIQALATKYGFEIPATHRRPGQTSTPEGS